jgi:hypothetical protein
MSQRRRQGVRIPHGASDLIRQGNPLLVGEPIEIWNLGGPHSANQNPTVLAGKSMPFSLSGHIAIGMKAAGFDGNSAMREVAAWQAFLGRILKNSSASAVLFRSR